MAVDQLIRVCGQHGQTFSALGVYEWMKALPEQGGAGLCPSVYTYTAAMRAALAGNVLEKALQIWNDVEDSHCLPDSRLCTAYIEVIIVDPQLPHLTTFLCPFVPSSLFSSRVLCASLHLFHSNIGRATVLVRGLKLEDPAVVAVDLQLPCLSQLKTLFLCDRSAHVWGRQKRHCRCIRG